MEDRIEEIYKVALMGCTVFHDNHTIGVLTSLSNRAIDEMKDYLHRELSLDGDLIRQFNLAQSEYLTRVAAIAYMNGDEKTALMYKGLARTIDSL